MMTAPVRQSSSLTERLGSSIPKGSNDLEATVSDPVSLGDPGQQGPERVRERKLSDAYNRGDVTGTRIALDWDQISN